MRRAAVRAFRTARLAPSRSLPLRSRSGLVQSSRYVLGIRHASGPGSTSKPGASSKIDSAAKGASSMYFRRVSVVVVSGLVGYGAWYTYKGQTADLATGGQSPISAQQSRGLSTSPTYSFPQPAQTEEVERKAVIVGPDSLYTAAIAGNEPITKDTDGAGRKVVEMLTPEQATQKLRTNEESYLIGRGKGVVRYDVVQIPSNDPIEDDHSEKIVELPEALSTATAARNPASDWMFWGVFDGHSGWTTSAKLRQVLINFVARELNSTYKAALADPALGTPSSAAVEAAIKTGFTKLDHEIVHESVEKVLKANSKLVAAELLAPALSGSCALLSFYDSNSKLLRVACTGDSRAVLGRRSESGKWTASALSVDQTGGNPDEEARMRKLHPGEDNVIRNGRVLGGLEPTRAFGDASYKWTREVSERLKQSFFGRTPSQHLRSPPYVTAEPVVTTTKIEPEKGDFVVMATDGLWEMLTNEEVVGLVGQWIEKQSAETNGNSANSWIKMFSSQQKGLPVEQGANGKKGKDGQKTPIRQQQWGVKGGENERFVVEDKNVATHLVRNALGGKDKDMVCALLTLPAPYSRRYRDDLTVEVIFFGNSDKSGDVVVNKEASASAKDIKAKL